ncbi:MAG: aminopeptidase, partial [Bacteroidota bacterium]
MIKKILLVVAIVATILVIWNYQLISYGIGQGIGQLKIVWNARPVNEYLQDVNVPDSIKQKLRFIE